ncbi:MAG: hypothetical protein R3C32_08235 [Chloroflexota bacterium]
MSPSTSAIELQNLAGTDTHVGKTRSTGEPGRYDVIFEYREESVGLEAGRIAVALVNHLVAPDDPEVALDLPRALERLIRIAERSAFGPSTQAIIDEAVSRDIPRSGSTDTAWCSWVRGGISSGSARR